MNGGKTIGIYNHPSIDCYWDPNIIATTGSSTLNINIINPGITDNNGGGCEIRIDYLNDGYVDEVYQTCGSISRTWNHPVSGTRTDRVDFEDYRGTVTSCYATLNVIPTPW